MRGSRINRRLAFFGELVPSAGSFGYGFVAQSCSAGTSFGLVLLAAKALGPGGLGSILVGSAAYLLVLGFGRALITNPLVSSSAAHDSVDRASTARFSLTVTVITAVFATGVLACAGIFLPTPLGRGVILFAPWLVPALIQDLGRSILFRDGRERSAALADATWLLTMAGVAPVAFTTRSDWAVTGCWGAGSVAGAAVALIAIRSKPASTTEAISWWRLEAWPFGRWLLLSGTLYSVASFTSVLALASILGAEDYGGLGAVQSVFAPLTLIGPAIALPGLPMIARALTTSRQRALAITWQLAAGIALVTAAYVVLLSVFPGVLSFIFGQEFGKFRSLILPVGVAQLLAAPGLGLTLLLMAQQRGRTLLWVNTLNAFLAMALSVSFASFFGLEGAAWARAPVAVVGGVVLVATLRWPRSSS